MPRRVDLPGIRRERVDIRTPRGMARISALIGAQYGQFGDIAVSVRRGRFTAKARWRDRIDIWAPMFRGRIVEHDGAVHLHGHLRPRWWALVYAIVWPLSLVAAGFLPNLHTPLATPLGLVLLGASLWWSGRHGVPERRKAIRKLLDGILLG